MSLVDMCMTVMDSWNTLVVKLREQEVEMECNKHEIECLRTQVSANASASAIASAMASAMASGDFVDKDKNKDPKLTTVSQIVHFHNSHSKDVKDEQRSIIQKTTPACK